MARPASHVIVGIALAAALTGASGGPAAARAPMVNQLVALRGEVLQKRLRATSTRVRVEGRRCAVAEGTALASLVRARPGRIGLADYGSCSRRARDAGGLYVRSIRGQRARGLSGWVYKVGNVLATAGAGDPAGPFGRGRLRPRQRVSWFYCRIRNASCQRTLGVRAGAGDGTITATVRGYDDDGKSVPVAGATVTAGRAEAVTDDRGVATLAASPGTYPVRAEKSGLVPSFRERVTVP